MGATVGPLASSARWWSAGGSVDGAAVTDTVGSGTCPGASREDRNVNIQLTCQPSYSLAYCMLDVGENLLVERDGMAKMSAGIDVGIGIGPGGMVKAAMRSQLGGESFFMGRYTARMHGAWVAVAPPFPGDIKVLQVEPDAPGILCESGSLLACQGPCGNVPGVDVDVKWAGVRRILIKEGATLLHLTGQGAVLLSSYGGIEEFHLGSGEEVIVDSGHLVGWEDTVEMKVGPLSSSSTAAFTGEWLVAKLTGPGRVWTQTRSEEALGSFLLPNRKQNTGWSGHRG